MFGCLILTCTAFPQYEKSFVFSLCCSYVMVIAKVHLVPRISQTSTNIKPASMIIDTAHTRHPATWGDAPSDLAYNKEDQSSYH